jgi:RNA polymerase subunit RPABC4/transcription elongation factor Spt4
MLMAGYGAIGRALLTLVLLAAWNVATTHCAFTAAANISVPSTSTTEGDSCPMHSEPRTGPRPEKKKGCADLPCCKKLPASKPVNVSFSCKWAGLPVILDYGSTIANRLEVNPPTQLGSTSETGPPGRDHFVEFVLKRSIPAHAPPRLS